MMKSPLSGPETVSKSVHFPIISPPALQEPTSFGGLVGRPICGTLKSAWILAGIER
jgi:hypothetical protein